MSNLSISIFLFICLIAAPASAFIISTSLLPVYILFLIAGFIGSGKVTLKRFAILSVAPVFGIILGSVFANPVMQRWAMRWLAALAAGTAFASELGMSNAAYLLHRTSGRTRYGKSFLESLALLVSLAGPFSKDIRMSIRERRKRKSNIPDLVQEVFSGIENLNSDVTWVQSAYRSKVRPVVLSCFAWCLFLSGIAGVP